MSTIFMAKTINMSKYAMDFDEFIDKMDNINEIEVPTNYTKVNKRHGKFKPKLGKKEKAE